MNEKTTIEGTTARVIFAATDLSEPADEALRQAHERAKAADAKLVVCHIVPNLARVNMLFPQRSVEETDVRPELHRQALQALIACTRRATGRPTSEFTAVVDDGTPYASIVERAEQAGADLIVVADRGATGLSRVLLGSVAERVVRYAHVPVLVARALAKTGQVVVATDLSDPALPAVAAGAREVRREGIRVTLLHCIESLDMLSSPEYGVAGSAWMTTAVRKEARERAHTKLVEMSQRFSLEASRRIVEGSPVASILSAADELSAELIVVGTRGHTGLRRALLGSVAESVVRHAACSVLVVRLRETEQSETEGTQNQEVASANRN